MKEHNITDPTPKIEHKELKDGIFEFLKYIVRKNPENKFILTSFTDKSNIFYNDNGTIKYKSFDVYKDNIDKHIVRLEWDDNTKTISFNFESLNNVNNIDKNNRNTLILSNNKLKFYVRIVDENKYNLITNDGLSCITKTRATANGGDLSIINKKNIWLA